MRLQRTMAVFAGALICAALSEAGVSAAGAESKAPQTRTVSGKIVTVNKASEMLTLKVGTKMDTIYWNAKTKVSFNSKSSTTSAIKGGQNATVKYTVSGNSAWVASSMLLGSLGTINPDS